MSPKRLSEHIAHQGAARARPALVVLAAFVAFAAFVALVALLSPGPAPIQAAPEVGVALFDPNWTQAVTNTTTVVVRTAGPNPSVYGQSLTFQATVTRNDNGNPVPGGTVTFQDNAVDIAGCVGLAVNASGQASCTISALTAGAHTIAGNYSGYTIGGDTFNPSSGSISQTVNKADTNTTLTSASPSPKACETIVLTATVTAKAPGSGTPTGTVDFFDGGVYLGTATLSAGVATLTTPPQSADQHFFTATYNGDSNYNTSTSSALAIKPAKLTPSVSLSASPASPQTFGTVVTLTATVTGTCGMPTGHVYFNDDGVVIGTGAVSVTNGIATLVVPLFSSGLHLLKAVYESDNEAYQDSESESQTYVINRAPTTTTLVSSANPSVWGQMVTFTATVSSGIAVTPTGQVIFWDGGTAIGSETLDGSGRAVISTAALEVGSHPIRAEYQSDQNFLPSSGSLTQTVNKANTTTSVVSCVPNPSRYGQSVTCTARVTPVAPGAGIPTGTIDFKVGGSTKATVSMGIPSPGEASWATSVGDNTELKPAGSHAISAAYSGDSHFNASTSGDYSQMVNRADTSTTLQIPLTTIDYGQQIQMTAIVSPVPPGSGTVTGTVQFLLNSVVISTTNLTEETPSAKYVTDTLPIGTNDMKACYVHGSNPNFEDSCSDTVQVEVKKAKSKTTLTSAPNPSLYGQPVAFTAVVTAAGASTPGIVPTGTVTLTFPTVGIMTGTLTLGVVIVPTNTLPVGVYDVTADYGGNAQYQPSSATWQHIVNRNPTTTTLTLSPPSPAVVGTLVTFTAIVSATGGVTPTGTVKFWDGVTVLGSGTLNALGVATFSTSALAAGSHSLKASYEGTPNFSPSSSDRQTYTITVGGSTTTVTTTPNPSIFGQTVTMTATVTVASGTPTGQVTFQAGSTTLGTAPLNPSGVATFSTAGLAAGTHTITAVYSGDSNYAGSNGTTSHTVNKANTTTMITSDLPDPSVVGQPVVVNFTVIANPPGGGTPTGNVTVSDGAASCTGSVAAGTCTLTPTTAGAKTLTATYAGDSNFNGSSDTEPHQVNPANTTTTVTSSPNPSLVGQTVTINATVTANPPGGGTPTGTVTFKDGATPIAGCSGVPLSGGSASCSTAALTVGTHTLNVDYSGDSNFNPSSGSTTHTVGDTPADLSVTKTDSPDPVLAGDNVTYLIVVSNTGPGQNVNLTDTLPPEATFVSITPGGWTCSTVPPVGSSGTIQCSQALGANGMSQLTVVVNVPLTTPAGTILRNTVQVNGTRPDPDLSNNTAIQETTVYRSPRFGDCNGDEAVDVNDVFSIVRRIFDPAYQGTSACDANRDKKVDAGDVPCTVLIMFGGPGACRTSESQSLISNIPSLTSNTVSTGPALTLPDEVLLLPGARVTAPINFTANGHHITSLAFSVDYDESRLSFDPADRDGNGVPDDLLLVMPGEFSAKVTFDADDTNGELDVFIGDITPPLSSLSDGPIGVIVVDVIGSPGVAEEAVRFSLNPLASFGDTAGQSVPGTARPTGRFKVYLPILKH